MPFQPITDIEVQTGAVIDTQLLTKIKNNLSEHETEVTAIQVAPPLVVVGTVVHSILTLAQYQSIAGTGWVLADGQSCVGSALHALTGMTNVPDVRGKVLRGKNNGGSGANYNPDGDLALGAYQDQATAKNGLTISDPGHNHNLTMQTGANSFGPANYDPAPNNYTPNGNSTNTHAITSNTTGITLGAGNNETRMKNITVNIFIKIN